MNNSLNRLFDGMADALRRSVLPHVSDEYARGQIFGVVFMILSIARRASWSSSFLEEQIDALQELSNQLRLIEGLPAQAPNLHDFPDRASLLDREAVRDYGDAQVCALIDWLSHAQLEETTRLAVSKALDVYMHRQLKHDIATNAKPMFAEMSRGEEDQP